MQPVWKQIFCIVGMSSYWCWTLLDRSNLMELGGFVSGVDASLLTGLTMLVVLALVLLLQFSHSKRSWSSLSLGIALVATVSFCQLVIVYLFGTNETLSFVSSLLLAVLRSGLMIVWFFWLVKSGKEALVKNLILCTTVTVAFFLGTLAIPSFLGTFFYFTLILASGLMVLAIERPVEEQERKQEEDRGQEKKRDDFKVKNKPSLEKIERRRSVLVTTTFYLTRFALGAAVGLTAVLTAPHELQQSLSGEQQLAAFLSVILLLLGVLVFRKRSVTPLVVITAPLSLSIIFIVPIALNPTMLLQVSVSFVWFCIIYISAVHIFFNKNLNNLKLPALVALALGVSSFGTFVGNSLISFEFFQPVFSIPLLYRVVFSLALFYALLIVVVYTLARLVSEGGKQNSLSDNEKLDCAIEQLTSEYQLTKREAEILRLLAIGYSRPYISEKLVLSTSTVKTHVNHVYKKLDINKRDDLLELVENAKSLEL